MSLQGNLHNRILQYVDAGFPILYIHTYEELKADQVIGTVSRSAGKKVIEWDTAFGLRKWVESGEGQWLKIEPSESTLENTLEILKVGGNELKRTLLVIKDGHHYFHEPRIVGMLKDISHQILTGLEAAIIVVSPVLSIPQELEKYITVLEIGYLNQDDIVEVIYRFIEDYDVTGVTPELIDEIAVALRGLSEYEIGNILSLAYSFDGDFSRSDLRLIYEQKQQVIKKSGILEMIPLKESIDDIGGLDGLKHWLSQKSAVMKDIPGAESFGVDIPKGVLISGIPGCGKSLSAKATAKLFEIPLLRLDMGRLLGKYVGESEANMRKAIALADAVSPCVLWIDELEKAFAGIGERGSGAEVTTRLFGQFLTWMQEKKSAVFVVATANDILKLPPELLRKGRFDEIFYVGLPTDKERQHIFQIHLSKRRPADLQKIDLQKLAAKTKGYSGADIEGVIKDSVEAVFTSSRKELTTNDVLEAIQATHPISEIMKATLERMQSEYRERKFKNASSE